MDVVDFVNCFDFDEGGAPRVFRPFDFEFDCRLESDCFCLVMVFDVDEDDGVDEDEELDDDEVDEEEEEEEEWRITTSSLSLSSSESLVNKSMIGEEEGVAAIVRAFLLDSNEDCDCVLSLGRFFADIIVGCCNWVR